MGFKLALLATLAATAFAANTNGGRTTFPYCACYEQNCGVAVYNYVQGASSLSFDLGVNPSCPTFNSKCTQDVNKIEINSFDYCRWTKVTASINGAQVPFTFDHQGVNKLVPGAQVLKLYSAAGLGLSLAGLAQQRARFTVSIDTEPGQKRCTSLNQLLNTTATPGAPLSIAFFSSNEKCCALSPPRQSPPPPPPSPPPPPPPSPPPPPVCQACVTVRVARGGPGIFSPYSDFTSADCAKLGAYITSNGCGTAPTAGLSAFTCTAGPRRITSQDGFGIIYSEIQVCASGSLAANTWQMGASNDVCTGQIAQFLVGGQCGVVVLTASSCGATSVRAGGSCQPPEVDFPHGSCFPGNSQFNGGRGISPSGIVGTPYQVTGLTTGDSKISFSVTRKANCAANASAPMKNGLPGSCCNMALGKIEMVINPMCRGQVKTAFVNGVESSVVYSKLSYASKTYPVPQQAEYQIVKLTNLVGFGGTNIQLVLRDGVCSAANVFFPEGKLWYAYFNGNDFSDSCCGTSSLKFL